VNVSSIFVGRETDDIVAVGDTDAVGDGVGEGVGVDVGVGVGDTLSLAGEDTGDACAAGEISFCGEGVPLGVADFSAFDGVGVGELRAPDGELFNFGVAVGVGRGTGVCSLRSTPM
jgi:hypothetical protein